MRVFIMPTSSLAFATEYVYFLTRFGISRSAASSARVKNSRKIVQKSLPNLVIDILKHFSEIKKKRPQKNKFISKHENTSSAFAKNAEATSCSTRSAIYGANKENRILLSKRLEWAQYRLTRKTAI